MKGNSHSYTHLILALGIVREPTVRGLLLQTIPAHMTRRSSPTLAGESRERQARSARAGDEGAYQRQQRQSDETETEADCCRAQYQEPEADVSARTQYSETAAMRRKDVRTVPTYF